mgnify:CR=1 FL=1
MCRRVMCVSCSMLVLLLAYGFVVVGQAQRPSARPSSTIDSPRRAIIRQFVQQHCVDCHNSEEKQGGLALDTINLEDLNRHASAWEKVVRKLRARQMPPVGSPRPDESRYKAVLSVPESVLDSAAADHPRPGRTDTFRRPNRTQSPNPLRHLLAFDVGVTLLLPAPEGPNSTVIPAGA